MKLQLLTTSAMENAVINQFQSEATGRLWQYVFDDHLHNYWSPSSTASQNTETDLGSARHCDGCCLFMANYDTDFASGAWQVLHSDDDVTYTALSGGVFENSPAVGSPLKFFGPYTGSSHRYWRVFFGGTRTQIVQVSRLLLFREFAIDVREMRGGTTGRKHFNDIHRGPGGVVMANGYGASGIDTLDLRFRLDNVDDIQEIIDAFDDSQGSRFPFVYVEDENYADARLMKFARDPVFEYHSPSKASVTLEMQQMPFIADGDVL